QAGGEHAGLVEYARARRQPQCPQDLLGIEISDADDFDLPHAEKIQAPQCERSRYPHHHHRQRRARPRQYLPGDTWHARHAELPPHATAPPAPPPCCKAPVFRICSSSGPTRVMSPAPSVNTTSPSRTARATCVVRPARSRTATVAAPARVAPRTTR